LRQILVIACCAYQAHHFGAADFSEGAAHELAFLGSDEYVLSVQLAAANDNPVVECRRQVEQMKVRALDMLGRSHELREAVRVQQARQSYGPFKCPI